MAVSLSDSVTIKRLIAIANSQLWYEDVNMAGTMTALAASVGDIDTTDNLNITSAFQKVFIVNGTKLKVADFVNTKIATTNVGSNPPDSGTVLTGGTSGAAMVVDYITSLSGACTIYGYRTTTATFTTETVTGTDDDGNAISFTTSGAETANPHWYNWTSFGNNTAFGSLPSSAYLVCTYRGRLVISGVNNYPNQWYMSRVAKPFDFLYGEDDPMSAVAGNNADAGQCPDIIRALIPFHDDYLIFGCAGSMWVLRGDPVSGGSLDLIDGTTGIFGGQSWCFDTNGNLYFWSNVGLSMIPTGVFTGNTGVINLTEDTLPNIIKDEAADPSTHRITLGYDKSNNGIIVSLTTITTGVNSNYFYSLQTKGFYPETYPEECASYSMYYYAANDTDNADLLIGSRDGYIRVFDPDTKDDNIGATTEAISSYVAYPITPLSDTLDGEGKLTELVFDVVGARSSGSIGDSDGFTYSLFTDDTAEIVLEDIMDGATPKSTDTISTLGRTTKIRPRLRGAYFGLKLSNSTASQSWSINRVLYNRIKTGKL